MEAQAILEERMEPALDDAVLRARAGHLDAFETLYHRHAGRVFAVCLRLTGDRSRAEELTQESFVRAWKHLSTFRGESGFSAWLTKIAVNAVVSDGRARRRRGAVERPVEDVNRLPAPPRATGPGAGLDLDAAIAALPDGARTVFVLHDVEGYRHGEISGVLGIASGTSKAQLHRARRLLREALRR